jgi:hypothetical protein
MPHLDARGSKQPWIWECVLNFAFCRGIETSKTISQMNTQFRTYRVLTDAGHVLRFVLPERPSVAREAACMTWQRKCDCHQEQEHRRHDTNTSLSSFRWVGDVGWINKQKQRCSDGTFF